MSNMAEKYKKRCLLRNGIFNVFISFVIAVSLLILATSMSRAIPSKHFYKLAACGDQIFTGKQNFSGISTREFKYICNITANVNMIEKADSKEVVQKMAGRVGEQAVTESTTTTTTDASDEIEMQRFHEELLKAAKMEEDFAKGFHQAPQREPAAQKDFNLASEKEPAIQIEFKIASEKKPKSPVEVKDTVQTKPAPETKLKIAPEKKEAPKTELSIASKTATDSESVQAIQRRSMPNQNNDITDKDPKENELEHFENYVNDSVHRESLSQSGEKQTVVKAPKIKHFAFLKVHKAGSTTMQNIFFRFGLRNNLTFVLPRYGHYLRKAKDVLPVQQGEHHDILSNHIARFTNHFFRRFTPPDSVNIAIVREPLERMISAAFYYREVWSAKYLMNIPKHKFILNLIRKADKYEKNNLSKTKNSMGLDFGFPRTITANDKEEIAQRMARLNKKFRLVLVMEKFDESLILLKRSMNWDISDVMYLPTNSHVHASMDLSKDDMAKFRATNFLDYIIYDQFTDILEDKIKEGGQDFQDEVEYFKNVLQFAKTFCDKGDENRNEVLSIPASKWSKAFTFPYTECVYIKMSELDFVDRLKIRHLKMQHLNRSFIVKKS